MYRKKSYTQYAMRSRSTQNNFTIITTRKNFKPKPPETRLAGAGIARSSPAPPTTARFRGGGRGASYRSATSFVSQSGDAGDGRTTHHLGNLVHPLPLRSTSGSRHAGLLVRLGALDRCPSPAPRRRQDYSMVRLVAGGRRSPRWRRARLCPRRHAWRCAR